MQRFHSPFFHLYGTNHDVLIVRHTFHHLHNIYRRVRQDELPEGQEKVRRGRRTLHDILCNRLYSPVLSITTRSRIARHCYPPGDLLLPFGQFTLCRACVELPTCVAERYPTLCIGFGMGAPCSPTVEKILCRSLFSKRSHIGNLRQIRKQGKGRSSKRKENRRLSFLFAHRRGYGVIPAAGAATLPPSADGESPLLRFSEKLSARKGRTR